MELKLVNGDYVPVSEYGIGFETITDIDELMQRVLFKLNIRRGSFPLIPKLGSDLWLLYKEKKSNRRSAAYQYICQALEDEKELNVDDVTVSDTEDRLKIDVELSYKGAIASLTVEI